MNNRYCILFIVLLTIMTACTEKKTAIKVDHIQWNSDSLEQAFEASIFDKDPIMMDFQTDWCVWCRKLEKETFTDSLVIEYVNNNYSAYSIDAEKGQGIILKKRFHVSGFPTIVFANKNGTEIDRIVGYMPPSSFLDEIKRIKKGKNTYPDVLSKTQLEPNNLEYLKLLASKQEDMWGLEGAKNSWKKLHSLSIKNSDDYYLASFKLASYQMEQEKKLRAMESFLKTTPPAKYQVDAIRKIARFYRIKRDEINEVAWHLKLVNLLSKEGMGNASDYNSFAWRMTELEKELNKALIYAKEGVKMAKTGLEKAQIMDTQAEVLWKLNRGKEAIRIIDKCIELQPDDNYYQKQRIKFAK